MASNKDHAEELAAEIMGNWKRFESFGWHEQPEDAERFAIIYTSHRDSGITDVSNAAALERELEPFTALTEEFEDDFEHTPDVRFESHSHWAVGHVDGFCIRVRDVHGELTPAFLKYAELHARLEDYPVLDSDDYSRREYDALCEAVDQQIDYVIRCTDDENILRPIDPENPPDVVGWLCENAPEECENCDDQGAYPSEDSVREALVSLGFIRAPAESV